MKRTMLFAALVAGAVFVFGCGDAVAPTQENGTLGSLSLVPKKAPDEGVIAFRQFLREPLGFNSFVEAVGQFKYTISKRSFADRGSVELGLEIEATFIPYGAELARKWYVSDASKEIVTLAGDRMTTLHKVYRINGRTDGVLFAIDLATDGNQVKMVSMRLVSKAREMPASIL